MHEGQKQLTTNFVSFLKLVAVPKSNLPVWPTGAGRIIVAMIKKMHNFFFKDIFPSHGCLTSLLLATLFVICHNRHNTQRLKEFHFFFGQEQNQNESIHSECFSVTDHLHV